MERITQSDVRRVFERHVAALERHCLYDPADGRYVLQIGSKTYGLAWRINFIPTGETGHYRPRVGENFLGMTAREAHTELLTRTRIIGDVFHALSEREEVDA